MHYDSLLYEIEQCNIYKYGNSHGSKKTGGGRLELFFLVAELFCGIRGFNMRWVFICRSKLDFLGVKYSHFEQDNSFFLPEEVNFSFSFCSEETFGDVVGSLIGIKD